MTGPDLPLPLGLRPGKGGIYKGLTGVDPTVTVPPGQRVQGALPPTLKIMDFQRLPRDISGKKKVRAYTAPAGSRRCTASIFQPASPSVIS